MRRNMIVAALALWPVAASAQDVPGIEICTVEKTMERRTSCLQSNVDFLKKTMTAQETEAKKQQALSNRRIELLQNAVIALQKQVEELQAAGKKAPDAKGAVAPVPTPAPAAKDADKK